MKPAREPASSRPKPCAFLKKPHESCPFAAPCGPRRKKNDRGQRSAFPSETSRFKPVILAHRGSALPWLVNDRAALRLRRVRINKEQSRQAGTKRQKKNESKTTGIPGPALSPGKEKTTITAAFKGGGFFSFPPGSNRLFYLLSLSLPLGLWPCCRKLVFDAADVGVVVLTARVSTRSVGEEMSPP